MIKIVCIVPVWNEMGFLEHKVNWCRNNEIDLYVINNESTDGTKEYLVKNGIPHHDLDTGGTFHLDIIHKEILATAKRLNPDWLIFMGCDMFAQTTTTLRSMIEKTKGNIISLTTIRILNTGEERGNPFYTYYYMQQTESTFPLIVKYNDKITLSGDAFSHPNPVPVIGGGAFIDYGMTKPKEDREATLDRRKKAWAKGLRWNIGRHYLKAQKINWTWDKDKCTDIRIKHPELIKNLQQQVSK